MPFYPNSSLLTENNVRNINYMTVLISCECLDLDQKNSYMDRHKLTSQGQ